MGTLNVSQGNLRVVDAEDAAMIANKVAPTATAVRRLLLMAAFAREASHLHCKAVADVIIVGPVCYDAVTNPAIFLPCGHDTCSDCFARIADPANAIRDGDDRENAKAKCPNCRTAINPKEITDYHSFRKVHMPDQLTEEEQTELKALHGEFAGEGDDDSDDSDTDSDTDADDDDVDNQGNLKGFIVKDDESETESEAEEGEEDDLDAPGPSEPISKGKGKAKQSGKPKCVKKGKGRKEKKDRSKKDKKKKKKSTLTLAELKKLSTRSKSARRRYMDRIRKDWISSAKIEKTMEALKAIMNDRPDEKVSSNLQISKTKRTSSKLRCSPYLQSVVRQLLRERVKYLCIGH